MTVMIPGLSVAEAAWALGVTPQRVRQILAAGELRYQRISLGRLIDESDVERLRREQEAKQRKMVGHGQS
jgi:excisionase family DNA binding protein